MSTEARHTPVPPRPSAPPPAGTARPDAGTAGTVPRPSTPTAPRPADDPDDEPSVFTPRVVRPPGPPAVPEVPDPVSPPPPPASARFPDAPPSAGAGAGRVGGGPQGAGERPAVRSGAGSGQTATPARTPAGTVGGSASRTAPGTVTGTAAQPARAAGTGPRSGDEPPRRGPSRQGAPAETASETTRRLRPVPPAPGDDPSSPSSVTGVRAWGPPAAGMPGRAGVPGPGRSWGAAPADRPLVSFAEPELSGARTRPRVGPRTVAAATCLVLGLGLIGGAVAGSRLTGDGGDDAARTAYAAAGALWHSVPVDQLFPPTVQGTGAGPGGADRTWTRIAVAPDGGCAHAFDPLLARVLAPVGCRRLLRATYTDATQSHVTTVGLLFTKADPAAMSALAARFRDERLDRRPDLMPRPYAAPGTAAAGFGDRQRASWTLSVLTDAPVVAYAVSGWADGRTVDEPQPAADAVRAGAATAPAQAGLGNEAKGLADRVERRLRKTIGTATETSA
ncbi:hypothetical protein [Streptomyces eurythermus]|uniref:hypothetical protein n=1 Tax=Streptomyces eurythermus TaxID=42237 RepID=UPI0033C4A52A